MHNVLSLRTSILLLASVILAPNQKYTKRHFGQKTAVMPLCEWVNRRAKRLNWKSSTSDKNREPPPHEFPKQYQASDTSMSDHLPSCSHWSTAHARLEGSYSCLSSRPSSSRALSRSATRPPSPTCRSVCGAGSTATALSVSAAKSNRQFHTQSTTHVLSRPNRNKTGLFKIHAIEGCFNTRNRRETDYLSFTFTKATSQTFLLVIVKVKNLSNSKQIGH